MIGKHAIGRICARIMGIVPTHQKRAKAVPLPITRYTRAVLMDGQIELFDGLDDRNE